MPEEDKIEFDTAKFLTSKIKWDWISFICFLMIIIGIILVVFFFYQEKVNECTSDPLKFTIKKLKSNHDLDMVFGTITVSKGQVSETYHFSEEGINKEPITTDNNYLNISK